MSPRTPQRRGRWRAATAAALMILALMLVVSPASAAPDSVWDRLARCEATGNWNINTGNGYSGGLQFAPSTWSAYAPPGYPAVAWQATREQQIVVGELVLAAQGWNAWPSCSRELGLYGYGVDLRDPESAMPIPEPEPAPEPAPQPAPPTPQVIPAPCDALPLELRVFLQVFFCPPAA